MDKNIHPVDLKKAIRLLNHGPTVLVSSRFGGVDNVMAAGWNCALDFDPPKLTVVISSESKTREFVERTGKLAIQIPAMSQADLTYSVGSISLADSPDKLKRSRVELFQIEGHDVPLVKGCLAWLSCKVIPEKHVQEEYDLFICEIVGAWADVRVFSNGRWHFENSDPSLRSLHHVAGGHFYAIGEAIDAKSSE